MGKNFKPISEQEKAAELEFVAQCFELSTIGTILGNTEQEFVANCMQLNRTRIPKARKISEETPAPTEIDPDKELELLDRCFQMNHMSSKNSSYPDEGREHTEEEQRFVARCFQLSRNPRTARKKSQERREREKCKNARPRAERCAAP